MGKGKGKGRGNVFHFILQARAFRDIIEMKIKATLRLKLVLDDQDAVLTKVSLVWVVRVSGTFCPVLRVMPVKPDGKRCAISGKEGGWVVTSSHSDTPWCRRSPYLPRDRQYVCMCRDGGGGGV